MADFDKLTLKRQDTLKRISQTRDVLRKLRNDLVKIEHQMSKHLDLIIKKPHKKSRPGRPTGYSMKLGRYFTPEELIENARNKLHRKPPGRPVGWRKYPESNAVNKK